MRSRRFLLHLFGFWLAYHSLAAGLVATGYESMVSVWGLVTIAGVVGLLIYMFWFVRWVINGVRWMFYET
jgi:hypothetical protein